MKQIIDWFKKRRSRQALAAIVILQIIILILMVIFAYFGGNSFANVAEGLFSNLFTEIIGALIAWWVFDLIIRREVAEEIRERDKQETLQDDVRSTQQTTAIDAIQKLRKEGLLTNGAMKDQDYTNAKWSGADLWQANLEGAILESADLEEANLYQANLNNANLSNAVLRQANLAQCKLNNAILQGVDLTGAEINLTECDNVDLEDAIMPDGEPYQQGRELDQFDIANFVPTDIFNSFSDEDGV